jgi:hypothetical protein
MIVRTFDKNYTVKCWNDLARVLKVLRQLLLELSVICNSSDEYWELRSISYKIGQVDLNDFNGCQDKIQNLLDNFERKYVLIKMKN